MQKIDAVIFDWGGVLIEDPAPALFKYCASAFGVNVERYIAEFEICILDFQTGAVSEQQFWANMAERLKTAAPKKDSLWTEAFHAAYKPRQDMFTLAANLRKAGCKTAILSNTEIPVVAIINKQKYDSFDVTVLSCLEGLAKPGREIYDLTLSRLGVSAKNAIFTDDKQENIEGAKKAGLNVIHFQNPERFKKELSKFFPNIV